MALFGIDIDLLDEDLNLSAAITSITYGLVTGDWVTAGKFYLASVSVGATAKALLPDDKVGGQDQGYLVTQRGSAMPHQIIYGKLE